MRAFLNQLWHGFLNVLIALAVILTLGGGAILLDKIGIKVQ